MNPVVVVVGRFDSSLTTINAERFESKSINVVRWVLLAEITREIYIHCTFNDTNEMFVNRIILFTLKCFLTTFLYVV